MTEIKTILLIDDDYVFLNIAKIALNKAIPNVQVEMVNNGEEAINKLRQIDPDIIFVDINMPVMGGWEFLDYIFRNNNQPLFKIFVVSSSIDPVDKSKAKIYPHVNGFIEKPLTTEKISEQLL
ncbi:MAG: response regulator [Candidatus Cyclobacteriaceae bacterium M2_1C_046]